MRNANGASLLLETLLDEGVTHLFGNPGTTELPLMDALVNEERLEFILTLHEGVAVSAAEGYGLSTGRPAAINLHVAPGLGNAMGLLYNAKRSGAPMLVTAGNQPQSGHFQEIILYDDLARMAEPLVKWSYEVRRVEDLEQAVRRAVKVSMTPPTGPVFLSLPGDVMLSAASGLQEKPTRIHTRFAASAETIETAAALIARAERPCIVSGSGVAHSGALDEVARFAEQIGARAYEENFANVIAYPMAHPLYAGKLPILAGPLRERLAESDLVFLVGTEVFLFSYPADVRPLPESCRVVHLDLNTWEMGKNFGLDAALYGDPKTTLPVLTEAVARAQTADEAERAKARAERIAGENHSARETAPPPAEQSDYSEGMPLPAFHRALGAGAPDGAVWVDEALTSAGPGFRRAVGRNASQIFGRKGGGIGNGLPMALGARIATPERPVICLSGDGSAMYSNQTLWTAAKYNVGAVFLIANNGAYHILKGRVLALDGKAKEFHRFVGMDLTEPDLDFIKLAESMGVDAARVHSPDELEACLAEAARGDKPYLIDAVVKPAPLGKPPQEL
ncbi:MAG: thiamine pyrophosphate-binding protein [Nitrospinae bacterium]|nr:thiamine pyrophosphate-binding protein [Nitrospinota bacterium]